MQNFFVSRKNSIDDLADPGDYVIVSNGSVIMNCPACGVMFVCHHKVVGAEPLTLDPSVVGPEYGWSARSQVLAPCMHHFWVRDGKVIDMSGPHLTTAPTDDVRAPCKRHNIEYCVECFPAIIIDTTSPLS